MKFKTFRRFGKTRSKKNKSKTRRNKSTCMMFFGGNGTRRD